MNKIDYKTINIFKIYFIHKVVLKETKDFTIDKTDQSHINKIKWRNLFKEFLKAIYIKMYIS